MLARTVRRNVLFLAGSVLAGLVIAFLISRLWPELTRVATAPVAVESAPAPAIAEVAPEPIAAGDSTGPVNSAPAMPFSDAAANVLLAPDSIGSLAPAVRASSPAVVSVYTQRTVRLPGFELEQLPGGSIRPRSREGIQRGLGSGVIVDSLGHIVTNHHVIRDSDQINVRLADGRTSAARVVGRDPDTDLAVLKIDLPKLP
ncbi:MAG: trypsin-like peptidase domain-containing protein, partial [Steroidobacteraceae bacterium]